MRTSAQTILFAGGGSGGHIFPNMAVLERLETKRLAVSPHFLISSRPLDAQVVQRRELPHTVLPAQGMALRPDRLLRFYRAFRQSEQAVKRVIEQTGAAAMVATGGFVAGPAVTAASKARLPVALVNLDAVPGRANKFVASKSSAVFSVYPTDVLGESRTIGMPLRQAAMATTEPAAARKELGLQPHRETLLIFAGSQGGQSLNRLMIKLTTRAASRQALTHSNWQVFHLTGPADREKVQHAYDTAGITARVETFCHGMGLAWSAATLTIARAGAGTVGEAWRNAAPTIFLPYPYHKDEHQRYNAEPLAMVGGAILMRDKIDPIANAAQITDPLLSLMNKPAEREKMRESLRRSQPGDGAETVSRWLKAQLSPQPPNP